MEEWSGRAGAEEQGQKSGAKETGQESESVKECGRREGAEVGRRKHPGRGALAGVEEGQSLKQAQSGILCLLSTGSTSKGR